MVQVCPLWSHRLLKAEGTCQRAIAEVREIGSVREQLNLLSSEVQGDEDAAYGLKELKEAPKENGTSGPSALWLQRNEPCQQPE